MEVALQSHVTPAVAVEADQEVSIALAAFYVEHELAYYSDMD